MKKACSTLALALCCAAALSVIGCEDISTSTTAVAADTTTTSGAVTTTTAGPAPTTTVAPGAKPNAAPSTTTTSPAMGAIAAPTPIDKLLKGTWTWDVDGNVDGAGADADLQYRIVDELLHYLEPQNGAGLALIVGKSFDAAGRSDLQAAAYSSSSLSTTDEHDPNVVDVGSIIALRTNTGQYAKIQVTGFEAVTFGDGSVYPRYNVRLRYVLYPR